MNRHTQRIHFTFAIAAGRACWRPVGATFSSDANQSGGGAGTTGGATGTGGIAPTGGTIGAGGAMPSGGNTGVGAGGGLGSTGGSPNTGGTTPAGGSTGSGGATRAGGTTALGGATGTGGFTGTGGVIGTGGVASDAGSGIVCTDDGGVGLAAVARQCTQDSDCTILAAAACCGADSARGIAKAQASAYSACFRCPLGRAAALHAQHTLGYVTDTGKTTPFEGTTVQPIDLVSVGCVGHLCTTDVVLPPADAGQDVGPSVDASSPAALCTATGGQVVSTLCCTSVTDFPSSCLVGACGCAPSNSHTVSTCTCATGCFAPGYGCVTCTVGADQTCNDNLSDNSLHGQCVNGRCSCNTGSVLLASGKCQ